MVQQHIHGAIKSKYVHFSQYKQAAVTNYIG